MISLEFTARPAERKRGMHAVGSEGESVSLHGAAVAHCGSQLCYVDHYKYVAELEWW